jgi:hypothetical protein
MTTMRDSLAAALDQFRLRFEAVSTDADALLAPLTDAQFHWRPAPGVWSCAQGIEHLNATARLYLPRLDEGIDAATRHGLRGEGPFTYNWVGRLFVWATQPPPRFRGRAPKALQPPPDPPRADVMAAFHEHQRQFIARLHRAKGLDLARARVSSPIATWLRMPLGSGFALMAAHEERHLWQARRLVDTSRASGGS